MEIEVKEQSGETVETIQLDDAVFDVPMNNSLVHQALVAYQLNKRHGTHDTKTRAQVSGGGRKPWIQKHTGRARQGSIRSPQWRHGGVVFGPHPRSYRKTLTRRMRRSALRCVLSQKAREGHLVCLNSLDMVNGKTKSMIDLLANLGVSGSALVVTQGSESQVVQAAHNVKKVWTLPVNQLNAQELLARETLVITLSAVRWAEESLVSDPHGRLARSGASRSRAAQALDPAGSGAVAEAEVGIEPEPESPPAEQDEMPDGDASSEEDQA
ncbi:MAG: 50S ribosomal protein L4 [SAR202 cluster bacterium Io17-Chloro-G9]|nr:MAG: 50S ribosomal protein L4 [SAR202 cluster bacterium Io17-Chloro-G9]